MSRKSKSVALYVVKVWIKEDKRLSGLPLVSNFVNELEAYSYYQTVKSRPEVEKADMSPGYQISKTAEEALETYMRWCR